METFLLYIIAASGLCAVSSKPEDHYHFVHERKTWTEALRYCRDKYTDLVSIDDMDDMNVLKDMADLSKEIYATSKFRAWIGLYDDVNSWRWSLSDRDFYSDGQAEFRNWGSSQPGNSKGVEHCVEIFSDGTWNDANCTLPLKAICSEVKGSNVNFILTNTLMTWTEAQTYCRTHHTDLASVRNITENQKVTELIPYGDEAWIGLFRDSWKWTDGRNSSFKYWINGEPKNTDGNENCALANFDDSGQWEDWACDWKMGFICYSVVTSRVIKVRLVKNSSLDLNDPEVMERMLQQIKLKPKDPEVKGFIKLSWRKQPDGKVFHKDEEETEKRNSKTDEL